MGKKPNNALKAAVFAGSTLTSYAPKSVKWTFSSTGKNSNVAIETCSVRRKYSTDIVDPRSDYTSAQSDH